MFLAAALGLSGCKQWGLHDEGVHDDGLRRNDLSEPARQIRVKERQDADKTPGEDAWMSDKAKTISRNLE